MVRQGAGTGARCCPLRRRGGPPHGLLNTGFALDLEWVFLGEVRDGPGCGAAAGGAAVRCISGFVETNSCPEIRPYDACGSSCQHKDGASSHTVTYTRDNDKMHLFQFQGKLYATECRSIQNQCLTHQRDYHHSEKI